MIENKKYYVDLINSTKANEMTELYHYSGIGFKKAKINQGIYRKTDNLLVGVLQWGCSAQEGIRLDKYIKEPLEKEQYLELNRFSMAESEGKNSESQAISLGIKWIKKHKPDVKLLVSYAGRREGKYGYIYQATNWEYLGYFVSSGFWLLDGEERHQLTLWSRYKRYGNQSLSFRDSICEMYHDVRQTWTKQFIYITRLDKDLHCASDVLPYPKPTNEFPICTRVEIYKENNEYLDGYKQPTRKNAEYYYEKEKMLFLRTTLIRQGVIQRQGIAVYDTNGNLLTNTETIKEASEQTGVSGASITNAVKTEKMSKNFFFRKYNLNDEPLEHIELDYLCEIDGVYFFNQSRVAEYCKVSRQAVSLAKQRKSNKIKDKEINWK